MSVGHKQSTLKLVWYASYGSNLKRERFMCYIKGGTPKGSTRARPYAGCRNKIDPRLPADIPAIRTLFRWSIPNMEKRRYSFYSRSRNIGRTPTLGRTYLITDEQFNQVVMQENSKSVDGSRFVPYFQQLVSLRQNALRQRFLVWKPPQYWLRRRISNPHFHNRPNRHTSESKRTQRGVCENHHVWDQGNLSSNERR
jgi:hypothetical protein